MIPLAGEPKRIKPTTSQRNLVNRLRSGAGKVNFPALMKGLRASGFTHGPLRIESLTPGDLLHTLAEAKKAKLFVESLT